MKKVLLLLAISAVLTFSAVCVSASTAYENYAPDANGKYTIIYNTGQAGGMYGIVAVTGSDAIIDVSNLANIFYIDQTSADENGNITFTKFAPKGPLPTSEDFQECTVFIGGPGHETVTQIGYLRKGVTSSQLLGDIDGSGSVDLDDAILLFQHSIFPDFYPIDYTGNVDFDRNNSIDLDDAILLFQYSIFPDFYPIG